jgi:hypothetical protein
LQNSPLESSCVVVALIENYSTSKPLKVSPAKSCILRCDAVVANERFVTFVYKKQNCTFKKKVHYCNCSLRIILHLNGICCPECKVCMCIWNIATICITYARLSDAIHLLAVQMQCAAFSPKHVCSSYIYIQKLI